jgi:glycosyltransferase involved in cell wall biosynthesis
MRLAILASGVYPYFKHGAEVGIFYLAKEFAKSEHDVSLYLSERIPKYEFAEKIELPRRMRIINLPTIQTRFIYNLSFILAFLSRLRRESERPSLIIVNIPTILSLTSAYLSRLILQIPYLVIIHGPPDFDTPSKAVQRVQCFLIGKAAMTVCVSKDLSHQLHGRCQIDSRFIQDIPNGFDEGEVLRAEAQITPEGRLELAFVGDLDENKDPIQLLRTFELVSDSMEEVVLNIVGEGPLGNQAREFVSKEQLQNRVVFHRSMKHEDLLELLARCTLLIVTSHREGMPTVVIEALALGKPVVGTSVGGLREIIRNGENGFLAPDGSPELLAKSILQILTDSDLKKRLSVEARNGVSNYTWSRIAQKYSEIFSIMIPPLPHEALDNKDSE